VRLLVAVQCSTASHDNTATQQHGPSNCINCCAQASLVASNKLLVSPQKGPG
jgi:hypothetical protein